MPDLAAFLAARLDEDEAAATAVAPLGYTTDLGAARLDETFSHARVRFASEDGRSRIESDVAAERHFARHDPARVLRDVAAKRAILALHQVYSEPTRWGSSHTDPAMRGQPTGGTTYWCEICDYDRDFGHIGSPQEGCETLRHLAAIYSGHPDYQGEWAP